MPDVYAFYHVSHCPVCLTSLSVSSRESGTTITEMVMTLTHSEEADPLCAEDALALLRVKELENENLRQIIESMVKQREPVLEAMKARLERVYSLVHQRELVLEEMKARLERVYAELVQQRAMSVMVRASELAREGDTNV